MRLPKGYAARAGSMDDAETIAALMNAYSQAIRGRDALTLE